MQRSNDKWVVYRNVENFEDDPVEVGRYATEERAKEVVNNVTLHGECVYAYYEPLESI